VNQSLVEDEVLRGAQIRKFLILHKELDPDTRRSRAPARYAVATSLANTRR